MTSPGDEFIRRFRSMERRLEVVERALSRQSAVAGVIARRDSQTITSGSYAVVNFNQAAFRDTHGFHSTTTNNSRVTIPEGMGGWYTIIARARWVANSTGNRGIRLRLNGTSQDPVDLRAGLATHLNAASPVTEMLLAEGDYVEMEVLQVSGGNLDVAARLHLSYLSP